MDLKSPTQITCSWNILESDEPHISLHSSLTLPPTWPAKSLSAAHVILFSGRNPSNRFTSGSPARRDRPGTDTAQGPATVTSRFTRGQEKQCKSGAT